MHRKGIIHCNADTLSRPPIEVNAVTRAQTRAITAPLASLPETREESETSSKSLDILEDESAMHYIKNKRHIVGLPKNQKLRIEKLSNHYKFISPSWYYRANVKSEEYKHVPSVCKRSGLAVEAHVFGHFQVEATYKRLKEKYFWKNMIKDVEKAVETCEECRKNHISTPWEHPAIALPNWYIRSGRNRSNVWVT